MDEKRRDLAINASVNEVSLSEPELPKSMQIWLDRLNDQVEYSRLLGDRLNCMIARFEAPTPPVAEEIPRLEATGYGPAIEQLLMINGQLADRISTQLTFLEQYL